MTALTKSDLIKIFKDYGVMSKKDLPDALQEYGVATKADIIASEKRTDDRLKTLERSLTIKITKSKNDLADRIANLGLNKAQATRVDKIERRVEDIETFIYA